MVKRVVSFSSAVVFLASALCVLAVTVPRAFGVVPYAIVSGSMAPGIPVGAMAFVDSNDKSPVPGDVVTFRAGNNVVTHRVVEAGPDGYVTKGDANESRDPGVLQAGSVLGTYVFHVPLLGFAFSSMLVKIAWAGVLILAAILPRAVGRKGDS